MLIFNKAPDFTKSDVENKKCIGCDHNNFEVRYINQIIQEYCCVINKQTFSYDCYTVAACKMYALQRLDQDLSKKEILTIVGAVSLSVGVLTNIILLVRRILLRRRLQRIAFFLRMRTLVLHVERISEDF